MTGTQLYSIYTDTTVFRDVFFFDLIEIYWFSRELNLLKMIIIHLDVIVHFYHR